MNPNRIRVIRNRTSAAITPVTEAIKAARRLKAEWESFLSRSQFEFSEDALSHELVSLEDAGLEEPDNKAIFGFEDDRVSSGVWPLADAFYEQDATEFMGGQ